jgi:hypothetical protein
MFDLFIGIDQTGAALESGTRAKPLPVAIYSLRGQQPHLILHDRSGRSLTLSHLHPDNLDGLLRENNCLTAHQTVDSRVALLIDSVFGLPSTVWPFDKAPGAETLWHLFARTALDTNERKGFGLKPAAHFFEELLNSAHGHLPRAKAQLSPASGHSLIRRDGTPITDLPTRTCERLAGANSVFRTRPYQRNIQCGTYRIWRDLGSLGKPWANIRCFETRSTVRNDRPWIFEAYPSLLWRKLLQIRTRQLGQLPSALKMCEPTIHLTEQGRALIARNPDHADAAVLAVCGGLLQKAGKLFAPIPLDNYLLGREGWIVGLE